MEQAFETDGSARRVSDLKAADKHTARRIIGVLSEDVCLTGSSREIVFRTPRHGDIHCARIKLANCSRAQNVAKHFERRNTTNLVRGQQQETQGYFIYLLHFRPVTSGTEGFHPYS